MAPANEDYIALLKQIVKERDKYNTEYRVNQLGEHAIEEQINQSTAPIVAELQKIDEHKKASSTPINFEVNPKLPSSIKPKYAEGTIQGSDSLFDLIYIGDKKLFLTKEEDGKQYVTPIRQDNRTYELTPDLQKIMEGYGNENSPPEEIEKYLNIVGNKNLKYIKTLKEIVHSALEPSKEPEKEGTGLKTHSFLPDNPVALYIELRKLLAAKHAGNNNVYNEVNAICKRLVETKYLSPEKYNKLINKHFPNNISS